MAEPTAADIRAISQVNFDGLGYPEGSPDPLDVVVDMAVAYIENVTARDYDDAQPAGYDSLMLQAARMRTEQIVYESQEEHAETAGDVDLISGFSAGSYSESRRDTQAMGTGARALNPWPALERLLWLLLTLAPGETNDAVEDRYSYWRSMLGYAPDPAWSIVEVDWADHYKYGYPYGFGGGPGASAWTDKSPATIYPVEE